MDNDATNRMAMIEKIVRMNERRNGATSEDEIAEIEKQQAALERFVQEHNPSPQTLAQISKIDAEEVAAHDPRDYETRWTSAMRRILGAPLPTANWGDLISVEGIGRGDPEDHKYQTALQAIRFLRKANFLPDEPDVSAAETHADIDRMRAARGPQRVLRAMDSAAQGQAED